MTEEKFILKLSDLLLQKTNKELIKLSEKPYLNKNKYIADPLKDYELLLSIFKVTMDDKKISNGGFFKRGKNIRPELLYEKYYDTFKLKGIEETKKELLEKKYSLKSIADLFTYIAKTIFKENPEEGIIFAEEAWKVDPKLYRLKWYMNRLMERGHIKLYIDVNGTLLERINFSPSELRKFEQAQNILNGKGSIAGSK